MVYSISVPDMDDSVALANIGGRMCRLRFRWDTYEEFWELSVFTVDMEPVFLGVKMVPNFPLNLFSGKEMFSDGYFVVNTTEEKLTRSSFSSGLAKFLFGEKE